MSGRRIAIGDVHGQRVALEALIAWIDPAPGDLLVCLGDYVSGGPETAGVLDAIGALAERPRTVLLRGNHDELMRRALSDPQARAAWMAMGGETVLGSYPHGTGPAAIEAVRARHGPLLDRLAWWHETEHFIFVHGSVDPALAMDQQDPEVLIWQKIGPGTKPHASGKPVICGHTQQSSGLPLDLGHHLCLDTGAKSGRWLTGVDLGARWCWQVDMQGRRRGFELG